MTTVLERLKAALAADLPTIAVSAYDLEAVVAIAEAAKAYWDCDLDGDTWGVERALEDALSALEDK